MKTAEQLIKEYLERGYSPESLRILAESREQPLRGEMLALLDAAATPAAGEESGTAEVACETGSFARVGEEMVFFVADDEPAASDEGGVDFDLMAETAPASPSSGGADEESVAEILIGDASGAEMVAFKERAVDAAAEDAPKAEGAAELGIWSRLWSRVAHSAADEAPRGEESLLEEIAREGGNLDEEDIPFHVPPAWENGDAEVFVPAEPEQIAVSGDERAIVESMEDEDAAASARVVEEALVEETAEAVLPVEPGPGGGAGSVLDEETVFLGDITALLDDLSAADGGKAAPADEASAPVPSGEAYSSVLTETDLFGEGAASEISADYLPGSMADAPCPEECAELDRAASMIDETEDAVADGEMAAPEPECPTVAENSADEGDGTAVALPDGGNEGSASEAVDATPPAHCSEPDGEPEMRENVPVREAPETLESEPAASGEDAVPEEGLDGSLGEIPEGVIAGPALDAAPSEAADSAGADGMADEKDAEIPLPASGEAASTGWALSALTPPVEAMAPLPIRSKDKATSRRERRRREREEKKKAKREKKKAAHEFPEIVLTRAGETGTPMPEGGQETREFVLADETATALPIVIVPQTAETAETAETVGKAETAETIETPETAEATNDARSEEAAAVSENLDSLIAERSLAVLDILAGEARDYLVKAYENAGLATAADQSGYGLDWDHAMIVANGGGPDETLPAVLPVGETAEEPNSESGNVILFSERFPVFAGEAELEDDAPDAEEGIHFTPVLHLLPPLEVNEDSTAEAESTDDSGEIAMPDPVAAMETVVPAPEAVSETVPEVVPEPIPEPVSEAAGAEGESVRRAGAIDEEDRRNILVALVGGAGDEYGQEDEAFARAPEHVIAGLEPEAESAEVLLEREATLRVEMESEYQSRLDAFATRLLDAQAAVAASEARVGEKRAELEARSAVLSEMKTRLEREEKKRNALLRELEEARNETKNRDGELMRFQGIEEEHARLFGEFEDLRKAYNEIVTDVMPGMREERDDLVMTVERQCLKEDKLRASLHSSRKRLAACYTLAAASCLMLIVLPVSNWLKSGEDNRQTAIDHQSMTQLQDTLNTRTRENIEAQNHIVELERKVIMARDELAKLHSQNRELAALASGTQAGQGIAVFRPPEAAAGGTPTRASTMALQATAQPGTALHVNEVMDPAGSIEELAEINRLRHAGPEPRAQMARSRPQTANIPVSAVASTRPRASTRPPSQGNAPAGEGALRPRAGGETAAAPARSERQARPDIVTAKVRKGEGVAQVVYRVLGSRDPDVIAWVIAENKIHSDRRGNPVIQPNQELKLPKDGRLGQAADARPRAR